MQWIFMLVGLVLGTGASESLTGALLGGLIGLSLGQALRLQGLEQRNAQLAAQLKDFAERFERGTRAMHERLVKVEQGGAVEPEPAPVAAEPVVSAPPTAEPQPRVAEAPRPEPEPQPEPEPELDWTLDPLPEVAPRNRRHSLWQLPHRSHMSRRLPRSKVPGANRHHASPA